MRVEFSFSNLGGAPATGIRVRFSHPAGVTYVEGSDALGDAAAAGETVVAGAGAAVADLPTNETHRIGCSFRVQERIEDGTQLRFQAALITDQTPVIASNAETILVRSAPVLHNPLTAAKIVAGPHPKPGDMLTIRATVANTGSSSAHEVVAILPVPPYTRYVPRSARVAGRAIAYSGDEPFDYAAEHALAERLPPGQSIELEYQAIVESPLPDGTRIRAAGSISSREIGEFALESPEIAVSSPPNFANDETALTVFCDDVVSPGTRVPIAVRISNSGTGDAHNVSMTIDLPAGLAYTPGSAHLDGQPVSDDVFAAATFSLGTVAPGRVLEVGISAIVIGGASEDLPLTAALRWKAPASAPAQPSQREFSRTLHVRVASRFTRARNVIEASRPVVQAREDVAFVAHVFNDGTAAESDVNLRVIPGAFLEDIRISESAEEPAPYEEPFSLGIVQPQIERVFTITARVASPVPDRARITLGAVLEFAAGTFDLGVANVTVRSRPRVAAETCSWLRHQTEPIRPGQTHDIAIAFTNDGADVLRDARIDLDVPPELRVERAQNARREADALLFGEVAPQTTHQAHIGVRLVCPPKSGGAVVLNGTLTGRGISPVHLQPIEIPTFAQPEFARTAHLRADPSESIKAGERVAYEIALRNSGDGSAQRLLLRATPSDLAVYVPGTTQLNGVTIADDRGSSQLCSERGLALTDVHPGMDVRVRWEMAVISPVAAGSSIETRAGAEWDDGHAVALAAPPLRVLSAPSLEAGSAGTPISLANLAASAQTAAAQPIAEPPPPSQEEEPEVFDGTESDSASGEVRELEALAEPDVADETFAESQIAEPQIAEPQIAQSAASQYDLAEESSAESDALDERTAESELPDAALAQASFVPTLIAAPIIGAPSAVATHVERAEEPAPENPRTHAQAAADQTAVPTLYADLLPDQLAQILRTIEKSDAGGLLPHLFASRALLPNALAGADPAAAQTIANSLHAMRAPLDRFFVRLRAPRLAVTAKDLEDRDARFAMRSLLDTIVQTQPQPLPDRPQGVVRLRGSVDVETLRRRAPALEPAPLGSVAPWIFTAQLLGSRIEYDLAESSKHAVHSDVLGMYRSELIKVFGVLETLPMPEFHRVLSSSVNRTLDEALAAVLEALRAGAHVAVD